MEQEVNWTKIAVTFIRSLFARHPAIAECLAKLSPRAIVVIDDAGRDGEKDMAHEFAKALPNHTLEFLSHEKGTAVLLPK